MSDLEEAGKNAEQMLEEPTAKHTATLMALDSKVAVWPMGSCKISSKTYCSCLAFISLE